MTTASTDACRRILASVSAYLDGDLDEAACTSIEAHCRACDGCAAEIAALQETVGLCRRAGTVPVPEDVRERARARIKRLLESSPDD